MARLLWEPTAATAAEANVTKYLDWLRRERGLDFADYPSLWEWSTTEQEEFWQSIWDYYEVAATAAAESGARGRADARRALVPGRAAELRRARARARARERAAGDSGGRRGSSEPRPISLTQLRGRSARWRAALRELGVEPGDRVAAYVGNLPEAVVAMLAVTSIGAVWTVCAPDFGTKGVLDRFTQVEPTVADRRRRLPLRRSRPRPHWTPCASCARRCRRCGGRS